MLSGYGNPRHHATSQAATAMAGRILEFRRDLLHLKSEGRALAAALLPYALHFGMAKDDEPLTRFARAFGDRFAGLEGWHLPAPERPAPERPAPEGPAPERPAPERPDYGGQHPSADDLDIWLGPSSAEEQ